MFGSFQPTKGESSYVYMHTSNQNEGPIRSTMHHAKTPIGKIPFRYGPVGKKLHSESGIVFPNSVHVHTHLDPVFLVGLK